MRSLAVSSMLGATLLVALPLHAQRTVFTYRVYVDCGHSDFRQSGSVNTLTFRFFDANDRELPDLTTTRRYSDGDCNTTQRFEVDGSRGIGSITVETDGNDVFLIDRIMGEVITRQGGFQTSGTSGIPCWASQFLCHIQEGVDDGGGYCLSTSPAHQVYGIANSCHPAFRFRGEGGGAFVEAPRGPSATPQPAADRNLALTGRATQSSTYATYAGADKAIDGNIDYTWYRDDRNSNSHTRDETDTAWQVDLGRNYRISRVVVYNGDDPSVWWRLTGALVQCWRNDDPATSRRHYNLPDMTNRRQIELDFGGVLCGTVRVIHQGRSRHLVMAEVQVWGR